MQYLCHPKTCPCGDRFVSPLFLHRSREVVAHCVVLLRSWFGFGSGRCSNKSLYKRKSPNIKIFWVSNLSFRLLSRLERASENRTTRLTVSSPLPSRLASRPETEDSDFKPSRRSPKELSSSITVRISSFTPTLTLNCLLLRLRTFRVEASADLFLHSLVSFQEEKSSKSQPTTIEFSPTTLTGTTTTLSSTEREKSSMLDKRGMRRGLSIVSLDETSLSLAGLAFLTSAGLLPALVSSSFHSHRARSEATNERFELTRRLVPFPRRRLFPQPRSPQTHHSRIRSRRVRSRTMG